VETAYVDLTDQEGSTKLYDNGVEFARFAAGLDFRLGPRLSIGPVVDADLGTFTSHNTVYPDGSSDAGNIHDLGVHTWVVIGVRLSGS
jgi:hypothetical protein